jgi:polyisoprenoid-binding protein YceI
MKKFILILLTFGFLTPQVKSQTYTVDSKNSKLEVLGTSSIHDWEIVAENMSGKANINIENDQMMIPSLSFSVPVESLKSGKSSMDNNTYEALKSEKYPTISYEIISMEVTEKNGDVYTLKTSGNLTMAGVTKNMNMTVKSTVSTSYVAFIGKVGFKMTDFKVDPPTAIFGTVKTGDEVTIEFNVKYNR